MASGIPQFSPFHKPKRRGCDVLPRLPLFHFRPEIRFIRHFWRLAACILNFGYAGTQGSKSAARQVWRVRACGCFDDALAGTPGTTHLQGRNGFGGSPQK
jgi:hypothetical protein